MAKAKKSAKRKVGKKVAGGRLRTTRTKQAEHEREVAKVPRRPGAKVGKPDRIIKTSMRSKVAWCGTGGTGGGGGGGGYGGGGMFPSVGGTIEGWGGNTYSPELSTDYLELPQSLDELRNYIRFFYRTDAFIAQAVDIHTELPLSKVRLKMPSTEGDSDEVKELARMCLKWCEQWAEYIGLLQLLIEITFEYHLLGEVYVFCEDTSPDVPDTVRWEVVRVLDEETGELGEERRERAGADQLEYEWLKKNYKGWSAIRVIPPENVRMESFRFTDEKIIELVPDNQTKEIIEEAFSGFRDGDDLSQLLDDNGGTLDDERIRNARRIVASMPKEVVDAVRRGENVPLNTDPDAGSFCFYLARKKSQYEPRGHSLIERILRTQVLKDKLRQAQTSIASRHMTPMRLVWAEDMDEADVEALREQVDLALADPDYSIITNFEVRWEEMGSDGRLLDLSGEYDLIRQEYYAGLGVTEGLMTGESSYSGERINLEVINTRYMLLRELLQKLVENYFFKPMCRRMGFIEVIDGEDRVLYPRLSFTRLSLRDNQDTFDALFNLYQKGSLDVEVILDLLNIDVDTTYDKIKRDVFTLNDPLFNEALRAIYSRIGDSIAENSDVAEKISKYLGLKFEKPKEEGGRFG